MRKDSGYDSTADMGEARICMLTGSTAEQYIADHFSDIDPSYVGGLATGVADALFSGRCDVLTAERLGPRLE